MNKLDKNNLTRKNLITIIICILVLTFGYFILKEILSIMNSSY